MSNKKLIIVILFVLFSYIFVSTQYQGTTQQVLEVVEESNTRFLNIQGDYQKGEILIKYNLPQTTLLSLKGSATKQMEKELTEAGIMSYVKLGSINKVTQSITLSTSKDDVLWVRGYLSKGLSMEDALVNLGSLPNVLYAEPNYLYHTMEEGTPQETTDPLLPEQSYLNLISINEARAHLESMGINPGGSRDVIVAVVDTGVDYTHPDLSPNMWVNTAEIAGNGIDDDNNGFIDDVHGVNVVSDSRFHGGDPMDEHGHGTHVAGIIGAKGNNGIGIRGVADNVRIMAIKSSNASGVFLSSDIAEGIAYAYQKGASVINMSFGGYAKSTLVEDALAIAFSQAVLIAAAGNDAQINEPHPLGKDMFPAAYPWVIGVMANDGNRLAGFSNFDFIPEDAHEYSLTAPGAFIMSTLPNGKYAKWSGTSMATPIVSGVAALLRSKFTDSGHNSRFIMGQLVGTSSTPIQIPEFYKLAYGVKWDTYFQVDANNALTKVPKPDLSFYDFYVWDSVDVEATNQANGYVDNGELIQLALFIRNHWGQATNVDVKIDTLTPSGIPDPYIEILTDTVNYGAVGSFSTDDNGLIYNDGDRVVGIDHPFVIRVAQNAPNDYVVRFNVTITAQNGLDPLDESVYTSFGRFTITIRNGFILPNIIDEDMTLTNDRYYIIPNATRIMEGATVTVEEGTKIQFWSGQPEDPYAETPMTYLRVDGKLFFNGSAEKPIEIFPSELMFQYEVRIYQQNQGQIHLDYVKMMNPRINVSTISHSYFSQNSDRIFYRYLSNGVVYSTYYAEPYVYANTIDTSIFWKLGSQIWPNNGLKFKVTGYVTNSLFDSNYMDVSFTGENNVFLNNFIRDMGYYQDELYVSSGWAVGSGSAPYASVQKIFRDEDTGTTYVQMGFETYELAQRYARYIGGHLAVIDDVYENSFIQRNISSRTTIGLQYMSASEGYRWVDGKPLGYTNFNNEAYSQVRYVTIGTDGRWYKESLGNYLIELTGDIYINDIVLSKSMITLGHDSLPYYVDYDLVPSTANVNDLEWYSLNEAIVTVTQEGIITPVSIGQTKVIVRSKDGVISKEIAVSVIQTVPLIGISIGGLQQVDVGQTYKIPYTLTPSHTTQLSFVWTSSDETIATVDQQGRMTAHQPGQVTITASNSDGSISSSMTYHIVSPVTYISFDSQYKVTSIDADPQILPITITPDNATNKTIIWESANPEVAYVDQQGYLIAVSSGMAVIRATAEHTNIYAELVVTVTNQISDDTKFTEMITSGWGEYLRFYALNDLGEVWYWGRDNAMLPQKIQGISNVVSMRSGYNNATLITADGMAYEIHVNGQTNSLTQINLDFTDISVLTQNTYDKRFTIVVRTDGTAWGHGDNTSGQLPGIYYEHSSEFLQLDVENVVDAIAFYRTSVFLTSNGKVYYSGNPNSNSKITEITGLSSIVSIEKFESWNFSNPSFYAKDINGAYYRIYFSDSFAQVEKLNFTLPVVDYAESNDGSHRLILTTDGRVYSQGYNWYGQLGIGTFNSSYYTYVDTGLTNIAKVHVSFYNSMAISHDGKIYIWGINNHGNIGDLTTSNRPRPTQPLIGFDYDNQSPAIQATAPVVNSSTFSVNGTIVIDYSEAIKSSTNYSSIRLVDSKNNPISIQRIIKLDKIYITPLVALKYGEKYTLNIPNSAIVDYFNNANSSYVYSFYAEAGIHLDRVNYRIDINDPATPIEFTRNEKFTQGIIFTSSKSDVATVDQSGLITPIALGNATILITSEDGLYIWTVNVEVIHRIPIQSLDVISEKLTVTKGQSIRVETIVDPINYNEDILWSTSDNNIATVDEYGFVTGLKNGTVTITATSLSGLYADSVTVQVIEPVTEVIIDRQYEVVYLHDSFVQLNADLVPSTATNQTIVWESGSPEIATVDQNGRVYPISVGQVVIRARAQYTTIYDDIFITITNTDIANIDFVDIQSMYYGDSSHVFGLTSTGDVWRWGAWGQIPQKMNLSHVHKMSLSTHSGIFLTTDGKLYQMQYYDSYASLLNTSLDNIVDVSRTNYDVTRTFVVLSDGSVWGMGSNYNGELAGIPFESTYDFIQIESMTNIKEVETLSQTTVYLAKDGKVYYSGNPNKTYTALEITELSNIVALERFEDYHSSQNFIIAKNNLGEFYRVSFDSSSYTVTKVSFPGISESIISYADNGSHQLAVTSSGKIYGKGYNGQGQLGLGHTVNADYQFTLIGLHDVQKAFTVRYNSFAIDSSGKLFGWGINNNYQVGIIHNERQLTPSPVMIGYQSDNIRPNLTSTSPSSNQKDVSINTQILLDFDEAIIGYHNYTNIRLLDSKGNLVSITRTIDLDKIIIKTLTPLKYGETYQLAIPQGAVVDYSMQQNYQTTLYFTTENGITLERSNYRIDINDAPTPIQYFINEKWTQNVIFSSSDDSIVTVNQQGVMTAVAIGTAEIIIASEDGKYVWTVNVEVIHRILIESLDINEATLIINKGQSKLVDITVNPLNYNEDILWVSSDPSIASVDEYGFVTGLKNGIVTITATSLSGVYADNLTVQVIEPVTSLKFDQDYLVINLTETLIQLHATIIPSTATNQTIIWESGSPEIATVDQNGRVYPVSVGNVIIRARAENTNIIDDISITITSTDVSTIDFIDIQSMYHGDSAHVFGLTSTGDVWHWGTWGQIPQKINVSNVARMSLSTYSGYLLTQDGKLYEVQYYSSSASLVSAGLSNIKDVSRYHYNADTTLIVLADGSVWGKGSNTNGELAGVSFEQTYDFVQLEGLSNIIDVETLYQTSIYLSSNGKVYYSGQPNRTYAPTEINGLSDIVSIQRYEEYYSNQRFVIVKNSSGSYYRLNFDTENYTVTPITFTGIEDPIVFFSDNGSHQLVVTSTGKLYSKGYNDFGQLGIGTFSHSSVYQEVTLPGVTKAFAVRNNTFAIVQSGDLYGWGINNNYQVGVINTDHQSYPQKVVIGYQQDTKRPLITSISPTSNQNHVSIGTEIVIDFDEAIKAYVNYTNIRLTDHLGNMVSVTRTLGLDKIILKPLNPLRFGEVYTLSIPQGAVVDHFMQQNYQTSINFTTEQGVVFERFNYRIDINDNPTAIELTLNEKWTQGFDFTSSNENILTVDDQGIMTPVSVGSSLVYVVSKDNLYTWVINVDVIHRINIENLSITDEDFMIDKGLSQRINLSVTPINYNEDILWTSSDSSVATVDEYGFVTGHKNGTVIITASSLSGLYSDAVTVQVIEAVTSIRFNDDFIVINLDDEPRKLDVTINPTTATNQTIIWESGNTSIAYVDELGYIHAVSKGTVVIRANAQYTSLYDDLIVAVADESITTAKFIDVGTVGRYDSLRVYALTDTGDVWYWGQFDAFLPQRISGLSNVVQMTTGGNSAMFLTADGKIYTVTPNGLNNSITLVNTGFSDAIMVSTQQGRDYPYYYNNVSLVVRADGTVWGTGDNAYKQLMNTTFTSISSYVQLEGTSNIKQALALYRTSVFLTTDGRIYYAGYPGEKVMMTEVVGLNNIVDIQKYENPYSYTTIIIAKNTLGEYFEVNFNYSTPNVTKLNSSSISEKIIGYASSDLTTRVVLTESGKVYTQGNNQYGQLGDGSTNSSSAYLDIGLTNITKVIYSRYNTFAIDAQGGLYVWGNNSSYQIGDLTQDHRTTPFKAYIGIDFDLSKPTLESSNPIHNAKDVSINETIMINLTEAVRLHSNYANIKLVDSKNNPVSINKEMKLDQLMIKPIAALKFGERYTLTIPSNSFVDYFKNTNNEISITFTTEQGIIFNRTNYRLDITDQPLAIAYVLNPLWTQSLVFTSNNTNVVTVSNEGLMTPIGLGAATITVSSIDGKYTWNIAIDVIHRIYISDISITEETMTINKGENKRILLTITPFDYNEDIIWTSSNPLIASVDEYGFVTGKMDGTVTITATSLSGNYSDTISVTVIEPVESIVFDQPIVLATVTDEPFYITTNVYPETATNKNIIWRSSNDLIAYFDSNGRLNPVNVGTIVVRATAQYSTIYNDIIVSITESIDSTLKVVDVDGIYYSNNTAMYAVTNDGSLWAWGRGMLGRGSYEDYSATPVKINLSNVVSVTASSNESWQRRVSVLTSDGSIYSIGSGYAAGNGGYDAATFTKASFINNIIDVSVGYNHTVALKQDGTVWAWGENGNGQLGDGSTSSRSLPVQMSQIMNAIDVEATSEGTYILTTDNTLYYFGHNAPSSSTIELPSGITIQSLHDGRNPEYLTILTTTGQLYEAYQGNPLNQLNVVIPFGRTINMISSSYDAQYILLDDGTSIAYGYNIYGKLGNGLDTINVDLSNPQRVAQSNLVLIEGSPYNGMAITQDGRLFIWGDNRSSQLADFTTSSSYTPKEVFFGAVPDVSMSTVTQSTPLHESTNHPIGQNIQLTFNEAIRRSTDFSTIYLLDQYQNSVSAQITIDWNKLIINPASDLEPNMTYQLSVPHNAITDLFGNIFGGYNLTFTTESAASPTELTGSSVRHYWSNLELQGYFTQFVEDGHYSRFYNNAILNNIFDLDVNHWLRFFTYEGDQTHLYTNNYWGTFDEFLVNKQVVDFNDYQAYSLIKVTPFLTEGNESMYPFVTDVLVNTATETNVRSVGAEPITIIVKFNRDMNVNETLRVFFGPDYPFTDYQVPGQWIDARTWSGSVTITPLTGDGKQYFRIRDGYAADDAWLWMGDDDARFMFEIKSIGAEAMNLQASGYEGSIKLTWMQDEFDTLAGYHMYRSTNPSDSYQRINSTLISGDSNEYIDYDVAPGQVYYYKFTIVKTDLTESSYSNVAYAAAYDIIPPQLWHTPLISANVDQDIYITATAIDNIAITEATLFYRLKGDTTYKPLTMVLGANNRYTAKIPASDARIPGIEYYIVITDGRTPVNHGTAGTPNSISIEDKPTISAVTPNSGLYSGGTTVTISGTNFKTGAKVFFSNYEGLFVNVVDSNTITVKTPPYIPSRVNVKVVNPDGSSHTSYNAFEYLNNDSSVMVVNSVAAKGSQVVVPIRMENVYGLLAVDLKFTYDASVLTFVSASKGAITNKFSMAINATQTNTILVSMASDTSVSGNGDILYLTFDTSSTTSLTETHITIDSINVNSINSGVGTSNGVITFATVYSLSGTVRYYYDQKYVPNVNIRFLSELALYSRTTSTDGQFAFSGITPDSYTLSASKTDQVDAITAYDASLILQYSVQLQSLTSHQQIAADTNQDGSINSMDAAMILQYVSGMRTLPFEGASEIWKFIYTRQTYNDLSSNYSGQDITAILIGDVSGNYNPNSTIQSMNHSGVITTGIINETEHDVLIPIVLDYVDYDLYSFETTIQLENGTTLSDIELSSDLMNAFYSINTTTPDVIKIAVASAYPINVDEPLLTLHIAKAPEQTINIQFNHTLFNEYQTIVEIPNIYRSSINLDLNADGIINGLDIMMFLLYYNETHYTQDISAYDTNKDGIIDVYDVIYAQVLSRG